MRRLRQGECSVTPHTPGLTDPGDSDVVLSIAGVFGEGESSEIVEHPIVLQGVIHNR